MSEKEYDHKKSTKVVGQLYPVLLDKGGKVIDGFHRLGSDRDWKTLKLEGIDSEEKLLVARCVANWHRRQVPHEEKKNWINGLAKIYENSGLKVSKKVSFKPPINEIVEKIYGVTGLSKPTIYSYLEDKYKQEAPEKPQKPRVPASQVISTIAKSHGYKGEDLVERHREEVKTELKEDEFFKEEVKAELRQEVEDDLFSDEKVLIKAISKAPEVIAKVPKPVLDEIGRHIPTITKEQTEQAVEAIAESERELEEKRERPETKERGKDVKNWMAHTDVVGLAESLRCPICENEAENLVWKCHPEINIFEAQKRLKKSLEEN